MDLVAALVAVALAVSPPESDPYGDPEVVEEPDPEALEESDLEVLEETDPAVVEESDPYGDPEVLDGLELTPDQIARMRADEAQQAEAEATRRQVTLAEQQARKDGQRKSRGKRVAGGVLIGVGLGAIVGGIVTLVVGVRVAESKPYDPFAADVARAECTTGKPCGDACIEWSDTCHIAGGGGGGVLPDPAFFAGGLLLSAAGSVGVVLGAVMLIRNPRVQIAASTSGISLRF